MPRTLSVDVVRIGLLIPTTGPTGIYGASCRACAELAVEQCNADGGILGRSVELVYINAGEKPARVAAEVARLVDKGEIDALAGWHISAVRNAVTKRIGGKIVYAYSAMHEGEDNTPGLFMLGERPDNQVLPAAEVLRDIRRISSWSLIGNDYVFPRVSADRAREGLSRFGASIVSERFVPLGTTAFESVVEEIERSSSQGVLMFLMGEDAVHFNRAFGAHDWHRDVVRLSPVVDENVILGAGACSNTLVYAAAAYFDGLATPQAVSFARTYFKRFGPYAPPLNAIGESCYESIIFLAMLADRVGSLAVEDVSSLSDGAEFETPRGLLRFRGNLAEQATYLAEAEGISFYVRDQINEL